MLDTGHWGWRDKSLIVRSSGSWRRQRCKCTPVSPVMSIRKEVCAGRYRTRECTSFALRVAAGGWVTEG